MENHYTHILSVIDEQEAEDGRTAFEQFQTELFTLLEQVHDAIDKARGEEEAQAEAETRVSRVRLLGEKWGGAYHRIETLLGELQPQLEGEPIDNLELLKVKPRNLN